MTAPKSPLSFSRSGSKIDVMTREEIAARLEAVEARGETRFVELGSKLDQLRNILVGDHGVTGQMSSLRGDLNALKAEMNAFKLESRADNKATRWTVVITMISSILAATALVMSVQANLLSAFQAGQTINPAAHGPG